MLLLALAGSALAPGAAQAVGRHRRRPRPVTPAPQITSPAAGATAWALDKPVVVNVTGGNLTAVTLTAPDGTQVRGGLTPSRWTSTGTLVPRTSYSLAAVAVGPDGQQSAVTLPVRTGAPAQVLRATISPNGRTVGVGRPVVVTFNHSVRRKADVEAALKVTTSRALGAASWSWTSARTVQFRPRAFWPAHPGVKVTADLRKVHAGPGLWGMQQHRGRLPDRPLVRDAGVERQAPDDASPATACCSAPSGSRWASPASRPGPAPR